MSDFLQIKSASAMAATVAFIFLPNHQRSDCRTVRATKKTWPPAAGCALREMPKTTQHVGPQAGPQKKTRIVRIRVLPQYIAILNSELTMYDSWRGPKTEPKSKQKQGRVTVSVVQEAFVMLTTTKLPCASQKLWSNLVLPARLAWA